MLDEKEITEEERSELYRQGQSDLSEVFLANLIPLVKAQGGMPELNYWKTTVKLPDGGVYLLSLLHVDGPKLQL